MIRAKAQASRRWLAANPQIPQTLFALLIKIVGAVVSFGLSLFIARTFGPTGAGAFGLMVTTLLLASTICLVGLDFVLIRTIAGDLKQGARGLARSSVIAAARLTGINALVMVLLLTVVVLPLMATFIGEPAVVALRVTTWGVVPLLAIRIVSAVLRGSGRVLLGQLLDGPISTGLTVAAFAAWAVWGTPAVSDIAQIYLGAIAATAVVGGVVGARDVATWGKAERRPMSPMLAAGWKIAVVVLIGWSIDWLILVALARFQSTTEVGLFRTTWQIASLFNVLVVAVEAVVGPRVAAAWRSLDRPAIARMYRQSSVMMALLASPLLLLCFAAPEWLLHFFGPEFVDAATALRILAFAQFVNLVTGPTGTILMMTGHERTALWNASTSLVLAVVLIFAVVPVYGLIGAALTSAAPIIFRNLVSVVMVRRLLRG